MLNSLASVKFDLWITVFDFFLIFSKDFVHGDKMFIWIKRMKFGDWLNFHCFVYIISIISSIYFKLKGLGIANIDWFHFESDQLVFFLYLFSQNIESLWKYKKKTYKIKAPAIIKTNTNQCMYTYVVRIYV